MFERVLDDTYQPLARLLPAGFNSSLLIGIDAGLRLRPSERPQSIADWRSTLPPSGPHDERAVFAMRGSSTEGATVAPTATRRAVGLWVALATAAVVAAVAFDGAVKLRDRPAEATGAVQRPAAGIPPPSTHDASAREGDARSAHIVTAPLEAAEESVQAEPTTAKPTPNVDAKPQPEQIEAALNLSGHDRARVQAALAALGFEVSAPGSFGPVALGCGSSAVTALQPGAAAIVVAARLTSAELPPCTAWRQSCTQAQKALAANEPRTAPVVT